MTNAKKTIVALLSIGVIVLIFSVFRPRNDARPENSNKMLVTASFYPLAYLAESIGGNKIEVINLTPSGAEPHEFEPSPRDIAKMEQSKILIVNGLGLEPWFENIKKNIDPKKTNIMIAGADIAGKEETKDPHVWLSPSHMKTIAERIKTSFVKADPMNEVYYRTRLQTLDEKLDALDSEFRLGLMDCAHREIVTSHTAFKYMAEDYGLTQIPIAGLSPDAEPSPKELGEIVNFVKEHNITYIFFESLVSPKLADTIATEAGVKTLVLNPLEGLTKKEGEERKDYISIMRENLANLQTALSCTK